MFKVLKNISPTDWPTLSNFRESDISINNKFIAVIKTDGNIISYIEALNYCTNKFGSTLASIYNENENNEALNLLLDLINEFNLNDLNEINELA